MQQMLREEALLSLAAKVLPSSCEKLPSIRLKFFTVLLRAEQTAASVSVARVPFSLLRINEL